MIGLLDRLARPFLYALDPEDAHRLAIRMLQIAPLPPARPDDSRLATRVFGLNFPNPIGIAAGFDKHAEIPDALLRAGFGFVEVGTVTPLPQPGNPRPRLFRLDADQAVINRLGFNSEGADTVLRRLAARARVGGIVGINVGANKDAPDRVADYVRLIEKFAAVASYVTVNISSPNTPGLRDMQQAGVLDDLLARVIDARERVTKNAGPTPVLLKIAPDLSLADLDDVVGIARARRVDGMIIGNTTVTRPAVCAIPSREKRAASPGGRSCHSPTACWPRLMFGLRAFSRWLASAASILERAHSAKFAPAQASFKFIRDWCFAALASSAKSSAAMLAALDRDGSQTIADYVGADAASVTAEAWPV